MVREEGCLPEARGLPARAVWPERPPGESGEREARAEARGFGGRVRQSSTGQGRRSGGKEEGGRNRNDEALGNGHALPCSSPTCLVALCKFFVHVRNRHPLTHAPSHPRPYAPIKTPTRTRTAGSGCSGGSRARSRSSGQPRGVAHCFGHRGGGGGGGRRKCRRLCRRCRRECAAQRRASGEKEAVAGKRFCPARALSRAAARCFCQAHSLYCCPARSCPAVQRACAAVPRLVAHLRWHLSHCLRPLCPSFLLSASVCLSLCLSVPPQCVCCVCMCACVDAWLGLLCCIYTQVSCQPGGIRMSCQPGALLTCLSCQSGAHLCARALSI